MIGCLAAWHWAVDAMVPRGVYSGPGGADYIQSKFPIHVVPPKWALPDDELFLMRWTFAEMKARLAVLFLVWCGLMILIHIWSSRASAAIKSVEPTRAPEGARRSA